MKGRARTPEQKTAAAKRLLASWQSTPHLRLGQLIINAMGDTDLFNVEDDELVTLVEKFVREHR